MGRTRAPTTIPCEDRSDDPPHAHPPSDPTVDRGGGWPGDLAALFTRERVAMVRLAHVICGSNGVAEEVVQEAFVRVRAHWDHIDHPGGYLRSTVVNLARSHLRHDAVEQRHAPTLAFDVTRTGDAEVDETWEVVCRLPAQQRAALALRFYEDLPLGEIARILDVPLGTVKSNIHRGLATLRKELS